MAKSARSSVKKTNRTNLRARVYGPVDSARTERLHAKLLELAQQPKPEPPKKADMEVDSAEEPAAAAEDEFPKDMEVDDGDAATAADTANASKSKKRTNRSKSTKRRQPKPRNAMTFPKTRGKGALKPHSEGRVSKRR